MPEQGERTPGELEPDEKKEDRLLSEALGLLKQCNEASLADRESLTKQAANKLQQIIDLRKESIH